MTPDNQHLTLYLKRYLLACLFLIITLQGYSQQKTKEPQLKHLRGMKAADSAAVFAKKLIDSARKNHDQPFEARVLLAQAYQAYGTGNEKDALNFARQAVKLSSPADTITYEKSATMVAYMLSRQGKNVEALNVAFGILKECEAHGWKAAGIDAKMCLADIYRVIKNVKQALPYAQQAANDALSLKDTAAYTFALSNISNIVSEIDTTHAANEKAARILEQILQPKYQKFVSDFTRARYLGNLARLYIRNGLDDRAIATLQQSMQIARKGSFKSLQKHDLNELMTLYRIRGDYKKAIEYGEQAIAVEPGNQTSISLQRNIYSQLNRSYQGVNDFKNALKYSDLYHGLNDSITAAETARIANELDKKYRADKRLLLAATQTRLLAVQRNYIIAIALLVLIASAMMYRWLIAKKKREAALMTEEHKQLEKLDALKTRFFANISHELRTPLTLILGPADQLLNGPDEPDKNQQKKNLTIISRNSKKLLTMVNELLDLGKLEAGKLTLKLSPVALARFIKVIYQGFSSAAEYKKIGYKLECDINEDVFALLDEDKFEKICNNLISNAVKFTPQSGSVTVTARVIHKQIEFTVANTGTGIHPDDMPYIFDRYYQGRRQEDSYEGGTGIGLAITREFAELMGGGVFIDNTWNTGTAFYVTIPLTLAETVPVPVSSTIALPVPAFNNGHAATKQTILLVEDHHEMAAYVTGILNPFYNLITALNGTAALSMLHEMPELPNLIISDVMMPEMDGFTLLQKLKESLSFCNIPVIILTALADNNNKLKALHTGVDDYITKPFLSGELIARTTNLINNAAARAGNSNQDLEEEPDDAGDIQTETQITSPADLAWLTEIEDLVRKQVGKVDLNLAMLSYDLSISERQLFRRIKSITGLTPNKYIRAIKLQIAREAIESGKYRTLAEISYVAGFDTPAYFSKLFKEQFGRDVNELL
ncbi:ATP-binding protein [Mucilaginibacter dorajii]|uniref:histidine kinase n=1 Tax=Mucilaginibacter dorajii TaxID=692994 RepID=A0ABP7R456_9SPHI|nr:ATP-binding protein [Mucilaginibacter dorajii]MCS3738036.1 signal transduction histidine kinase/DNA-binding response OmpR family regulator [Mucilaginibacter dorajii]